MLLKEYKGYKESSLCHAYGEAEKIEKWMRARNDVRSLRKKTPFCVVFSHAGKKPLVPRKGNCLYSQTSPQRPPWGQKKVAVVERWRLWGVLRQFFLESTTCFLVLNSCLLCPIIMVIQSYIISRDKMLKILELCLESKYQSDKTSKVRSHYLTHHTKIISSTP